MTADPFKNPPNGGTNSLQPDLSEARRLMAFVVQEVRL